MEAHINIEEICKSLSAVEGEKDVNLLCYNYKTQKKDMPAWMFRLDRAKEFIKALDNIGLEITKKSS